VEFVVCRVNPADSVRDDNESCELWAFEVLEGRPDLDDEPELSSAMRVESDARDAEEPSDLSCMFAGRKPSAMMPAETKSCSSPKSLTDTLTELLVDTLLPDPSALLLVDSIVASHGA
jgi:hypothetical protein